ncbi:small ribosomal subunit protein mS27-like [Clavelina lepadiformis]|uniref:small ribosomal subunit protein mS27-like n=1 Tax=Clavelina lepadiformis TaxID=159417 RepID=UPI0040420915
MALCFRKLVCFKSSRVKQTVKNCAFYAFRNFLSNAYLSPELSKQITSPASGSGDMAEVCMSLNRCHERNMPVSSMMIDRMIRCVQTDEHLSGSLFYLHHFRHTENSYYIRPWTAFTFVKKCLEVNPKTLVDILTLKTHYGIFPDVFSLNKVLDVLLEKQDLKGALDLACQMFLLEVLDNKTSQALAIEAVSRYWEENTTEIIPTFEDVTIKRNVAGILYCIGMYLSNPSLTLLGQSLLGSIEAEHGIRATYQEPWGPLWWKPGYLENAVSSVENLNEPISKQSVDILLSLTINNNELHERAAKTCHTAQEKGLISDEDLFTLKGIAKSLLNNLPKYEAEDREVSDKQLWTWLEDRTTFEEIEKEVLSEYKEKREALSREIRIEKEAHDQAVENLGFWDLARDRKVERENPNFYLREDYIEGALEDLVLLERFRDKRSIVKDPIILVS